VLYGYCLRAAGDAPPDAALRGIDGRPVVLREAHGVGLWFSELDTAPAASIEGVIAHDRVVRAALRSATPLPVRYGTRFASTDAVDAALHEGAAGYLAALRRVAGRVEMGLTLRWRDGHVRREPPAPGPAERSEPGPGRAYLEARRRAAALDRAVRADAAALVERVREVLGAELPESVSLLPEAGVAARVAHLVHRGALRDYGARVETLRDALDGVEILRTGPWAPYSFP
jgi:hypothetical protein